MKINYDKHQLTQEQLWRVVRYEPETGKMFRILKTFPKSGKEYECNDEVVGSNNRGYKWLKLGKYMYLVHRLAFLWMTGKHPRVEVDHINGDRNDNRWVNLRECSPFDNSRNQGMRSDNTSGVRGVNYSHIHKKWVARISHKGIRISIGYFKSFDDAVLARKQSEIDLGYHPNHAKRSSWVR